MLDIGLQSIVGALLATVFGAVTLFLGTRRSHRRIGLLMFLTGLGLGALGVEKVARDIAEAGKEEDRGGYEEPEGQHPAPARNATQNLQR